MKRPRKKMSSQKLDLIRRFQNKSGQAGLPPTQGEEDPLARQAPPEASAQDFKHTLPVQGSLHQRHK